MRWFIIALITVLSLSVTVSAEDVVMRQADLVGAEQIEDALNGEVKENIGDFDLSQKINIFDRGVRVLHSALRDNESALKTTIKTMARILLIVIVCLIAETTDNGSKIGIVSAAGSLGLMLLCASEFYASVGLGKKVIAEITDFSNVLIPVMVSAATMSGALSGSGAIFTLSTLFSNLLVRLINFVLVPVVYAYLALALTDSFLQEKRLERLQKLLGWTVESGLKIIVYIYIGFLSVTSLLTGAADEAAIRATKAAISGVVPVVGGIISNAASTVLSGAAVLKSSIGAFGMLAIIAIFLSPFIKIAISYLMLKASAALGGVLGSKLAGFLEAISGVMGYMLAMTGTCALVSLISCCFLVKAVHI